MLTDENKNTIAEIITNYENEYGIKFESEKVKEFVKWMQRKCELSGHDENYMPLLVESELPLQVQGLAICGLPKQFKKGGEKNGKCGEENNCG